RLEVRPMARVARDPDADRDRRVLAVDFQRGVGDVLADPLANSRGGTGPGAREDADELVAPVACDDVTRFDRGTDPGDHGADQLIPGIVPMRVVHALEVV